MATYETVARFLAEDKVSSVARNIADSVSDMAQTVTSSILQASGATGLLNDTFAAAAGGPLAMFNAALADGVKYAVESADAMADLSARTGYEGQALSMFEDRVKAAFKTGLVGSIGEASNAVEEILRQFDQLENAADFDHVARNVLSVAKAFAGGDSKSIIGAIDAVMDRFKDFTDPIQALDSLVYAAQTSSLSFQEVQKIIEGFGAKFQAAGLSGVEMFNIIIQGGQAGLGPAAFGGLATAVDNFHNKLANPKPEVLTALKTLGLSDLIKDLNANKITYGQAIDEVITSISKIDNPAKQTQTALSLFGPAINKIGGVEALTKLKGFSKEMEGIAGQSDRVADIMNNKTSTAIQRISNDITDYIGNAVNIGAGLLEQLFGGNGIVIGLLNRLPEFINGAAQGIISAFEKMASEISATVQAGLKGAQLAISNLLASLGAFGVKDGGMADAIAQGAQGIINKANANSTTGKNSRTTEQKALGGALTKGAMTWVGDGGGPELVDWTGPTPRVYSNRESDRMLAPRNGGGGTSKPQRIEVPVYLNGREIARAIRKSVQQEAQRVGD